MFQLVIDNEISLALVQPSFASCYLALVAEERTELSQWLAWPPHATNDAFFLSFIKHSLHDYADNKSMTCAILYKGSISGNISFNAINHDTKCAEIGYWLSKHYRGNGIVTRSVKALTEYAFCHLDMHKVQISAAVDNHQSRAVCERLGMSLEGIITNKESLNGRILDHAIYGYYRS
ncbi:GNAT family N-acetyltransferase [Vibrio sp. 10N.261.51.F12]|uniref:GNAT family N-acetyltransferase n=1 Tax=Vibrio sp. 10N.261.51.F12 TaxID=3229679 RepID=UPI00354D9EB5